MAARRHGQEGAFALSLQMYKARFASFTTFQFAQKVSKSLRQDTFHGSKSPLRSWTPALEELSVLARADPLAVGVLSWTHALGQLSVLPHADPLAVLKGFASQQRRKGRVDRARRRREGEGRAEE